MELPLREFRTAAARIREIIAAKAHTVKIEFRSSAYR
jgi:hypothetical protein